MLSVIVVNILIDKYSKPGKGLYVCKDEGELSKMKSMLVNGQYLAARMRTFNLQSYLFTSVGDDKQGIRDVDSVLEDLCESIIGAVYLDSGRDLKITEKVVKEILYIDNFLHENAEEVRISYKNDVQEWCQQRGYGLPRYRTFDDFDGYISFCEITEIGASVCGEGHSKKEAENSAAENILQILKNYPTPRKILCASCETAINKLQEHCQQYGLPLPKYEIIADEVNSDNGHTFTARCLFGGEQADGIGGNIKTAKKNAAYNMLKILGLVE